MSRPLLPRLIASNASATIDAVAALDLVTDPTLGRGTAGQALLFAHLARAGMDPRANERRARDALARSWRGLEDAPMGPSLLGGITGIGWVSAHLDAMIGDCALPLDAIDEALSDVVARSPFERDLDVVSGLAGIGLYFLARLPDERARRSLDGVVARLDERAVRDDRGVAWRTDASSLPPSRRSEFPDGRYNLGLAHGVPGIVIVLAEIATRIDHDRARSLARDGARWLLAQRVGELERNEERAQFAYWVADGRRPIPSRLGWCYGDLGVACALLAASRALGDEALAGEAHDIARIAARRSRESSGVVDAGLCHGAAGVAHQLGRLARAMHDETLRSAADAWLGYALELRGRGEAAAGFSSLDGPRGQERASPDDSFICGATGVALGLLAAITDVDPSWDRVLAMPGV